MGTKNKNMKHNIRQIMQRCVSYIINYSNQRTYLSVTKKKTLIVIFSESHLKLLTNEK